jgi:Protein of unknown function (DUF1559)
MKRPVPAAIFFAVFAAPFMARADEQSNAAARAAGVAPYVDDMTVAVAHLDLSRVDVGPLAETLGGLLPEVDDLQGGSRSEAAKRINQYVGPLVKAGVKDVYFTVALGGQGPIPRVLAILPLGSAADEKAVRAVLEIPAEVGRRIGDALVIGLPPMDKLPPDVRSSPRPELTEAFKAAGEGTAQVVLIPPAYTRRVIEELMPQLPKEIGGGPISILTRGISWAALEVDLPPRPGLRLVFKSQDAQAAEALCAKWMDTLRLAGQDKGVRKVVPQFDPLVALLTPRVERDRLVLNLDGKTATTVMLAAVKAPLISARNASERAVSTNRARNLSISINNYNDTHKHFPAAASYGADGKPLLSWRVYILPFVEQDMLFQQFHLNEPWDSPHNKTLIDKMPALFQSPRSKAGPGKTNYLVPVGNGALYASSRDEPTFKDVKDGASHTIMLVEVDDRHAVTWTKPDDYQFDPKDPLKGIGGLYEGGFVTAFCDGSVQFLSKSIDPKTLAALFTRAGGEAIGPY